jgi:hypothetical protein
MARNPADRFQSAAEMAHELRRWLDQATVATTAELPDEVAARKQVVSIGVLHGVIVATLAAAAVAIGVFLMMPGLFGQRTAGAGGGTSTAAGPRPPTPTPGREGQVRDRPAGAAAAVAADPAPARTADSPR